MPALFTGWVEAGGQPSEFGSLTPRTYGLAMRGLQERDMRALERQQALAWNIGQLVMTGYHKPQKYPSFNRFAKPRQARAQTASDMLAAARRHAHRTGATIQ